MKLNLTILILLASIICNAQNKLFQPITETCNKWTVTQDSSYWKKETVYTYKYDLNGNRTEILTEFLDKPKSRITYKYNSENRVIEENIFNYNSTSQNWVQSAKNVKSYSATGKLLLNEQNTWKGGVRYGLRVVSEFNGIDSLVKEETFKWGTTSWVIIAGRKREYIKQSTFLQINEQQWFPQSMSYEPFQQEFYKTDSVGNIILIEFYRRSAATGNWSIFSRLALKNYIAKNQFTAYDYFFYAPPKSVQDTTTVMIDGYMAEDVKWDFYDRSEISGSTLYKYNADSGKWYKYEYSVRKYITKLHKIDSAITWINGWENTQRTEVETDNRGQVLLYHQEIIPATAPSTITYYTNEYSYDNDSNLMEVLNMQFNRYTKKFEPNTKCIFSDYRNVSVGDRFYENNQFSFYPNPATNSLSINVKSPTAGKLFIYNSVGQVVMDHTSDVKTGQLNVDISYLKPGVYFISFLNEDGISTAKLIKN